MAYNQPVRFLYRGDKVVALRYVREARRLLFLFIEELTKTGARSGRRISKLPDGGQIELVVAYQQVTVTITTPMALKAKVRSFDDFVTIARTASLPNGIDFEHPQQILRAPVGREPWRTFFYDQSTPGYEEFDRPKGTYRRNPDGTELFPDGITSAGNVDWVGPNQERISWYGPDTRYWYDAYRQPRAQYGRFVFCLGQVLLDVDQYCADSQENWAARLVMGAGIRDLPNGEKWLYVVTTNLVDVITPVVEVPRNSVYFSENFPIVSNLIQIRALRLKEDLDSQEAQKWSVDLASSVLVWEANSASGCNPWVFNRDCTKAVTFIHTNATVLYFQDVYSTVLFDGIDPPADSYRLDLTFEDPFVGVDALTTIQVQAGGKGLCAVDFDDNNEEIPITISREPHAGSPSALVMYFGNLRVPMWYVDNSVRSGYTHGCVRRSIAWADAREGAVVCDTQYDAWTEVAPRNAYTLLAVDIFFRDSMRTINSSTQEQTALPTMPRNRDVGALQATAESTVAPFVYMWLLSAQYSPSGFRSQTLGLSNSTATRPHDPVDCYGQFGVRANTGTPVYSQAIGNVSAFFNNRADKHGHKVTNSGAARGDTLMFSGHDPGSLIQFGGRHDDSVSFVTGADFPTLTGVSGTYQRYHPLWLMGLPIGGEKP